MLTAARQEGLHLENVSTSGISASLMGNLEEVADARRQGLCHLKSSLDLALTLQENEAETKAEEMSKRILQVFLGSKHEGLHDCLHTFPALQVSTKTRPCESAMNAATSIGVESSVTTGTSSSWTSSFWHPAYARPRPMIAPMRTEEFSFVDALVKQTIRWIAVVSNVD